MNNKFKRFNKILMMTVAILLCFVLISTSVVSGIFAKYVITRSAGATVSLKAFGITLSVDGMATNNSTGITKTVVSKDTNNNALEISVTGISLAAGESIDDVVKFTIDGTPNVDSVKLKVQVVVSGYENFSVSTDNIKSVTSEQTDLTIPTAKYIPFGCTMKTSSAVAGTSATKTVLVTPALRAIASNAAFAELIRDGLVDGASFSQTGTTTDTVEKTIYAKGTTSLTTKYYSFGFTCWASGGTMPTDVSTTEADLIQTFLSKKTTANTFTVKYIVSLEQVV